MPVDITDTCARVRYTDYSYSIDIVRLAGNEENTCVRLIADTEGAAAFIDLMPGAYGPSWQLQCYVPKRIIASGTLLELHLKNNTVLDKLFITDAGKIGQLWLSIVGLTYEEFTLLSQTGVKQITVKDDATQVDVRFIFSTRPQEHYETEQEGEALLKLAFKSVMEENSMQQGGFQSGVAAIPAPVREQPAMPLISSTSTSYGLTQNTALHVQENAGTAGEVKAVSHLPMYNVPDNAPELRRRRLLFLAGVCMVMFMILAVFAAAVIKWKIRL